HDVHLHYKNVAIFQKGEEPIHIVSYDTINPSFEYGTVIGKLSSYVSVSYLHNGIGVENPTRSSDPIHDDTDQFKEFGYFSYIIDQTSRITLLVSDNHSDFQIPNTPGLPPVFSLSGVSTFDSAKLDENQSEDSFYTIVAYQKKVDDF